MYALYVIARRSVFYTRADLFVNTSSLSSVLNDTPFALFFSDPRTAAALRREQAGPRPGQLSSSGQRGKFRHYKLCSFFSTKLKLEETRF